MKFEDLVIGQIATSKRVFKRTEVEAFSKLSNDYNPIHLDKDYAKKTIFKKNIVHGMLYASMLSAIIANDLPGEGSVYMQQSLRFLAPVYFGDVLIATVEIKEIDIPRSRVYLATNIIKEDSKQTIVLDGEAIIKKLDF